ncbi:MAG: TfuA-like protein [Geminicoccaceae bacterium]
MSRYVFLGPSLPAAEAMRLLDATYLPPVRQGDLLRLVRERRPKVIGIVDGCFRDVPACWHKEILFALASGVRVFGAASMGALRAAELDGFGMVGVGEVYAAYRSGRFEPYGSEPFEDDDEVAVLHGPPETGYVALSEAMVNIRATLARAAASGVIEVGVRDRLVAAFRAAFYPDRRLSTPFPAAADARLDDRSRDRLASWLPSGRVDVKAADARAMLTAIATLGADPPPFVASFRLEESAAWQAALAAADPLAEDARPPMALSVLDEARLSFRPADDMLRRAVERRAGLMRAADAGVDPDPGRRRETLAGMRTARGLFRQGDLQRWCRERNLDEGGLRWLVAGEARLDSLARNDAPHATEALLDLLRLDGAYLALRKRAERKQRALADLAEPVLDKAEIAGLISWHLSSRNEPVPVDLDARARSVAFADAADLARALWREREWRRRCPGRGASDDAVGGIDPA